MTPRLTLRTVALLIVVALCVLLVLAVLFAIDARRDARRAGNDRDMAEGRTTSAVEAISEIGRLEERGAASDNEVREAHDAIRQADPADRDRVARFELCRLQHRADCDGLLGARPAGPDA